MKYCNKCGQELSDETVYCPNCGANVQTNNEPIVEDKNSVGFNVLSFFIPLVGLILYIVWKKETPIKAKGCGIWALVGFIFNIIISICSNVLLGSLIEGLM